MRPYAPVALLLLVIFANTVSAQTFLGYDYELYKGATLKIQPVKKDEHNGPEYGYFDFYKKPTEATQNKSAIYCRGRDKSQFSTIYDSLVNREFTVTGTVKAGSYVYLELYNDINKTIYYRYTPDGRPDNLPFTVESEIRITDDYLLAHIDSSFDKVENEKKLTTPEESKVVLYKYEGKDTMYAILFNTQPSYESYDPGEGFTLAFKDGTKIRRDDIKIHNTRGEWNSYAGKFLYSYYGLVFLEPSEIQKVLTTPMVAFRLGSNTIDVDYPAKYMRYMKLLMTRL